jgi:hypothetical protein
MSRNCICNIPGGTIVAAELNGVEVRCLKAQRIGRDYVHYYLVPLDPAPEDLSGLRLIYADPEAVLKVVPDVAIEIAPVAAADGKAPASVAVAVGEVLANGTGHYLKVFDTEKTERYHAYVDLGSGMIRLRQERNVTEVFRWRLSYESSNDQNEYIS